MSRVTAATDRVASLASGREVILAVLVLIPGAFALAWPTAFFEWIGVVACGSGALLGVDLLCYAFVQRALVAAVCVGLVAPLVGTFLVYRQMALIGDALAHTAFAGVAVGGTIVLLGIGVYGATSAISRCRPELFERGDHSTSTRPEP